MEGFRQNLGLDPDDGCYERTETGMETCPECGRKTVTGLIVCKGVNRPRNKGRRYQYVSKRHTFQLVIGAGKSFSPPCTISVSSTKALTRTGGRKDRTTQKADMPIGAVRSFVGGTPLSLIMVR